MEYISAQPSSSVFLPVPSPPSSAAATPARVTANRTVSTTGTEMDHARGFGAAAAAIGCKRPREEDKDVKSLTGQRFDDSCGSDKDPIISVWYNGDEKLYAAKRISDMVLDKFCQIARDDHAPVSDGTVTVPANVKDNLTEALKLCGRMLYGMGEPVVAAIAYCFAEKASVVDGMNILVFGLGGGTVNGVLLAMEDGILKVKATDGDTIGVNDFVDRMVGHVANEFKEHNEEFCVCPKVFRDRVWAHCEDAVKVLSSAEVTTIEFKCPSEGMGLRCSITRNMFEELNMDLFHKCLVPAEKCLRQAGVESSCVQSVVLVGCSTKVPRLQYMLQNMFSGKQIVTLVNPDESFARSAAALSIPLFKVTRHSLGLQLAAGMVVMIPKNTPIPIKKDQLFTTISDNQISVLATVCEVISKSEGGVSAHPLVADLILNSVTPAPKGMTKIKVCLAIDNEGGLELSMEDVGNQNCYCRMTNYVEVERLVARSSDK